MVARGRRPDAAALLLAAALVAAGDDRVRAGTWGGRHIGMEVTEGGAGAIQDRKSTRLNSSHSQISYAVFCLKKKTAAMLAKGGARIVINYSSSQKQAEQTADLCRAAGGEAVVVQGDVSRDDDFRMIGAAAAPWGRLDALINNAGTTKHMAHENLDGLSAEDFQRLVGVNTIGPFQMVRAARSLLEAGANASGRASAVV